MIHPIHWHSTFLRRAVVILWAPIAFILVICASWMKFFYAFLDECYGWQGLAQLIWQGNYNPPNSKPHCLELPLSKYLGEVLDFRRKIKIDTITRVSVNGLSKAEKDFPIEVEKGDIIGVVWYGGGQGMREMSNDGVLLIDSTGQFRIQER